MECYAYMILLHFVGLVLQFGLQDPGGLEAYMTRNPAKVNATKSIRE